MNRVFSGIQPTGNIHLGNYLGALKNFVAMQEEFDSYYMVADMHAITVRQESSELRRRSVETAALFMACGCAGCPWAAANAALANTVCPSACLSVMRPSGS